MGAIILVASALEDWSPRRLQGLRPVQHLETRRDWSAIRSHHHLLLHRQRLVSLWRKRSLHLVALRPSLYARVPTD